MAQHLFSCARNVMRCNNGGIKATLDVCKHSALVYWILKSKTSNQVSFLFVTQLVTGPNKFHYLSITRI